MSVHNFNTPSRQSAKGIIVIFGVSIYKIIKATFIAIAAFAIQIFRSEKASSIPTSYIVLGVSAFILFFLVLSILKYLNFKFHVNDSAFVLQSGIINKEEISINKNKIQNVYIKQNLLQQIINVVSLSVETAGDDKTEVEIKALHRPKALQLKELLLSVELPEDVSEEVTVITDSEKPVFFKASMKLLFLEGISENHFKSFVLILAFIFGIYQDLKDFFNQLDTSSQFSKWFDLDAESFMGILLFNVVIVFILIVVAFLFSLITTVIQNFDLTVTQKTDGFEISKGLFNKISLSLKTSRIQTTSIVTNRFKKALGLYQLRFTQAMVNKKQRQKFSIIGLKIDNLNAFISEILPSVFQNSQKNRPDRYLMYRVYYIVIIPLIIINVLFYFATPIYFLFNIPIVLLIVLNAIYRYKKAYYSFDTNYITVGSGNFISTVTTLLEAHKIQAITVSQNVFQKRRDLGSLNLYTAGKAVKIPHIDLKTAYNLKNYFLYKVQFEDKDWM